MKKQLFLLLMTLLTVVASADTVEIDGIFYSIVKKGQIAEVTSNPQKYSGSIEIPYTIVYEDVTCIVNSIGDRAFASCKDLTQIVIPSSVETIGSSAFSGCTGLTTLSIPGSVINIKQYAFNGCNKITSVEVDYGLESLGSHSFYKCTNLISVTLPNSMKEIGEYSYSGCDNLKNVSIPESVTSIGNYAFENCLNLESLQLGNCSAVIGVSAFSGCTSLTSIVIPDKITDIGNYAFYGCEKIVSATIGNGVEIIGQKAFSGCTSLKTINIGTKVNMIGAEAFHSCNNLTAVNISDISSWCKITFNAGYDYSIPLYYPHDTNPLHFSHHLYLNGEEVVNLSLPDDVDQIGPITFYECYGLKSVVIPNGVKKIGSNAFTRCNSLSAIEIAEGLSNLDSSVFSGCTNLITVSLPNSLTSISDYTFSGCSSLVSINLPNHVNSIGKSAFKGCSNLSNIGIPYSVTTINDAAFQDCISLTTINIPNNVTSIGSDCFSGCRSIKLISIGKSIKNIRQSAFANCENLLDFFVYTEDLPITALNAFEGSYPEYVTLHVPAVSIDSYKAAYPWSGFKSIEKIVMPEYTLTYIIDGEEYKSYELEEGAIITPEPAPTKEGYTFSGWSEIPETMPAYDVIVTGTFVKNALTKCATPTIAYDKGEMLFSCETEDVKFISEVKVCDAKTNEGEHVKLESSYTITVYATKEGYDNSEIVTSIIQWRDGRPSFTGFTSVTTDRKAANDTNGDGTVDVADIATIISEMAAQARKK